MTAVVRPRVDSDLPALLGLLRRVHEASGYPGHWPEEPGTFVASPHELAAWVAGDGNGAVGHVALHDAAQGRSGITVAQMAGLAVDEMDMVGRLFVDPGAQRGGIGRALLDAAVAASHARGRTPVLDVLAGSAGANAFYRSLGWRHCGEFHMTFGSGVELRLAAYAAPA